MAYEISVGQMPAEKCATDFPLVKLRESLGTGGDLDHSEGKGDKDLSFCFFLSSDEASRGKQAMQKTDVHSTVSIHPQRTESGDSPKPLEKSHVLPVPHPTEHGLNMSKEELLGRDVGRERVRSDTSHISSVMQKPLFTQRMSSWKPVGPVSGTGCRNQQGKPETYHGHVVLGTKPRFRERSS
jgi:hypothetical protein